SVEQRFVRDQSADPKSSRRNTVRGGTAHRGDATSVHAAPSEVELLEVRSRAPHEEIAVDVVKADVRAVQPAVVMVAQRRWNARGRGGGATLRPSPPIYALRRHVYNR